MNNSKISLHYKVSNINNNSTSKKAQVKFDSFNSKKPKENALLINSKTKEEEEEKRSKSKSCYKTPYISNNDDLSYSKMEMPISYQLTNGRCVRLRNSQNGYGLNLESESNLNINNMDSNSDSSDSSQIIDSFILKNEKKSLSKDNNSLLNYGKKSSVYPMKFMKHHKKKLMKEESQKFVQSTENEMKTYKKYNLMINPSYKYNNRYISSPIHKFLPYCKKNDEHYKKNLISYIRNRVPGLDSGAKSVSGPFANYAGNNNNEKPKDNDYYFFLLKRKKKIYSTKKVFAAEKDLYNYCLINGRNRVDYSHPKKFKFFFDNDIGFDHSWQSPLIVANGDDDVETDDEVLNMAKEKCMDDLIEGINTWNKSSRLCRNFVLAKKINRIVNTPTFNSIAQNKRNRIHGKDNGIQKSNSKLGDDNDNIFNSVSFVSFRNK